MASRRAGFRTLMRRDATRLRKLRRRRSTIDKYVLQWTHALDALEDAGLNDPDPSTITDEQAAVAVCSVPDQWSRNVIRRFLMQHGCPEAEYAGLDVVTHQRNVRWLEPWDWVLMQHEISEVWDPYAACIASLEGDNGYRCIEVRRAQVQHYLLPHAGRRIVEDPLWIPGERDLSPVQIILGKGSGWGKVRRIALARETVPLLLGAFKVRADAIRQAMRKTGRGVEDVVVLDTFNPLPDSPEGHMVEQRIHDARHDGKLVVPRTLFIRFYRGELGPYSSSGMDEKLKIVRDHMRAVLGDQFGDQWRQFQLSHHDLRRTFGRTLWFVLGDERLQVVSNMLGHEQVSTTVRYLCLNQVDQIGALEARTAFYKTVAQQVIDQVDQGVESYYEDARRKGKAAGEALVEGTRKGGSG